MNRQRLNSPRLYQQAKVADMHLIQDLDERDILQQHVMEAIDSERARIGHDLHDGVGQLLTSVASLAETLHSELEGSQKEDAGRIFHLIRETIHQLRQLSHGMSPLNIQGRDLSASLLLLADSVQSINRRKCVTDIEEGLHITDEFTTGHLYRIAQESISNAIRHGSPKEIQLKLSRMDVSQAVMEIYNDGAPIESKQGHASEGIGLRVMKHRAGLIQATLNVSSPAEGGVLVTCQFPLASVKSPQTKRQ